MNEQEKNSTEIESEVLLERVREIEAAKVKVENSDAQNLDRDNTAVILNEKRDLSEPLSDDEAKSEMSKRSRRGFLVGGATALVGIFGWRWMPDEAKQNLLRRAFEFNEKVSQVFYRPQRLAPEFPPELARARVNGAEGLSGDFNLAAGGCASAV